MLPDSTLTLLPVASIISLRVSNSFKAIDLCFLFSVLCVFVNPFIDSSKIDTKLASIFGYEYSLERDVKP